MKGFGRGQDREGLPSVKGCIMSNTDTANSHLKYFNIYYCTPGIHTGNQIALYFPIVTSKNK